MHTVPHIYHYCFYISHDFQHKLFSFSSSRKNEVNTNTAKMGTSSYFTFHWLFVFYEKVSELIESCYIWCLLEGLIVFKSSTFITFKFMMYFISSFSKQMLYMVKQIVLYRLMHQGLQHRQLSIVNVRTSTADKISLNTCKRGK